jgi:hypothetical protein
MSVLRYKTVWPFNISSMQKFHAALFAALVVLVSGATSFAVATFVQERGYGVSLPQGPAVFETSLQSRISSSDTSMTLVANSVRGGSTLSGYQCFTIDEGRTDMEFVCGTISGTTVSSLERGIDPLTATSSNSTLKFAHRVGANVKVTDFPLIQRLRNLSNGAETFPRPLYVDISTSTISGLGTSTIPTKEYVDYVGSTGCSDASDTARGCVERATAAEAGAGTATGATGAALFLGANIATSSCGSATGFSVLVASTTSGKLPANCLNTAYPYAFTALQTFAAFTAAGTTTISASNISSNPLVLNSLAYRFPSARGASSTVLSENGSGQLIWSQTTPVRYTLVDTTNVGGTGGWATSTKSVTIPGGTLNASSTIEVQGGMGACVSGGTSNSTAYLRTSTGVTIGTLVGVDDTSGDTGQGSMGRLLVVSDNSATFASQVGLNINVTGTAATPTTLGVGAGENTSSVNFANDVTLTMAVNGNCSSGGALTSYVIVVER